MAGKGSASVIAGGTQATNSIDQCANLPVDWRSLNLGLSFYNFCLSLGSAPCDGRAVVSLLSCDGPDCGGKLLPNVLFFNGPFTTDNFTFNSYLPVLPTAAASVEVSLGSATPASGVQANMLYDTVFFGPTRA